MPKVPEYNLPKFNQPALKTYHIEKPKKRKIKPEHLKDIDTRTRETRQAEHIQEFKDWYAQLSNQPYSDIIQGQLSMLSAVLWHLLPKNEFKKLVTSKKDLAKTPEDIQREIASQLSWID